MEATVEANLKRAGALRQSILRLAFSGRLVSSELPQTVERQMVLVRPRGLRLCSSKPSRQRGISTMGYPRYHEQSTLLLIYRTLTNLDYITANKHHGGPFEITQLINSFMGVFAHPWDQLLDKSKLETERLSSTRFRECGFPELPQFPPEGEGTRMESIHDYLRVLRNAMAHGNFKLLDRKELRSLRQRGTLPKVSEKEITGLRLWNTPMNSDRKNWITVLDIYEMRNCIEAMARLCEKRSLWKDEIRVEFEKRESRRGSRVPA